MKENGPASSSGADGVTPLGIHKPPMTDRNWNNSELKKFSVTQSKSNADIVEELNRFNMQFGGDYELTEEQQAINIAQAGID